MFVHGDVGFRPIEFEDLELLRKLHNDMSTLLQLGSVELVSSDQQVDWWKSLAKSKSVQRHSIIQIETGDLIGILRIQNIDLLNKNCEIGLDIVPALRGRGYGRKSYFMILEYLFMHFNMHMVYLRVGEFNDHAKNVYEKIGFYKTGEYKQYLYRHGRYWDYAIYTMIKEDYLAIREKQSD